MDSFFDFYANGGIFNHLITIGLGVAIASLVFYRRHGAEELGRRRGVPPCRIAREQHRGRDRGLGLTRRLGCGHGARHLSRSVSSPRKGDHATGTSRHNK